MFKPGDKVIRVKPFNPTNSDWLGTPVHKGEVHEVRVSKIEYGESIIELVGINNPINPDTGCQYCYDATFFAPYNAASEYIAITFTEIKEPVPCAS